MGFARENVCNHLASSGVIMKGSRLLLGNDRFRDCAHIGTWSLGTATLANILPLPTPKYIHSTLKPLHSAASSLFPI